MVTVRRTEQFKILEYWINERHRIYLKRRSGASPPWTEDVVLQRFRFCNVFRELDRGTVYLWDKLRDVPMHLQLFNIHLYRTINKPETADAINFPLKTERVTLITNKLQLMDHAFSPAYILKGVIPEAWRWVWDHGHEFGPWRTVESAFHDLLRLPEVGPFLAHQIAQDLRATDLLRDADDGKSWAFAGPGAKRGLAILGVDPRDHIEAMQKIRDMLRLEPHVPPLEVKDVQASLCELQKYVKYKSMMEGGPRCKSRKYVSSQPD